MAYAKPPSTRPETLYTGRPLSSTKSFDAAGWDQGTVPSRQFCDNFPVLWWDDRAVVVFVVVEMRNRCRCRVFDSASAFDACRAARSSRRHEPAARFSLSPLALVVHKNAELNPNRK